MNPRLSRLRKDYEKLQELAARSPFIFIEEVEGNPPDKYILHLTCKGVKSLNSEGKPIYSENHRLSIRLHNEYPRRGPEFELLTPLYHPNISRNGAVCIGDEGDRGFAPSMGLDDLIIRIVQIIRYENFSSRSAYNHSAASWANQNRHLFPLDNRQIVGEELIEINIWDEIQIIDLSNQGDDLLDEIVIL